ncbi:thioredoxin domain-containing protein [Algicola sagamiensis]|uniref:thioredoxin domain-containing protein n=1 Tax=Algicola sagamiensis TaxID=163869 RepID=UPI00039CC84F|nr:thioredoxin domain-containing protein [Algicola sagamiensis]
MFVPLLLAQSKPNIDRKVALAGNEAIYLSELDLPLTLKLYDLDWQAYEMRYAALARLLEERKKSNIQILLKPPQPPRIQLPSRRQPAIGNKSAPVHLSIFCSYVSAPCARLQPVLSSLKERFGSLLRFVFYDRPMPFHRHGKLVAIAARCAHSQGKLQDFQHALFAQFSQMDQLRILSIARQLNLEIKSFQSCMQKKKFEPEVMKDIKLAQNLGLGNVPVVFINGLYIKGPQQVENYAGYIDSELLKQNIQHEEMQRRDAVVYKEQAKQPLIGSNQRPISRRWLSTQLVHQVELASQFVAATHQIEGVRLLKLKNVEATPFFQELGLKSDDVVLRVNGQWVHEEHNPLWSVLEMESNVSLELMRQGLPVKYDFKIQ